MYADSNTSPYADTKANSYSDLLVRIKNKDTEAESTLVERFYRGVFLLLMKRCQKDELCRDLSQETFIVLIEHARSGKIKQPEALPAFVRQIANNLMIAHFRKEKRRSTDSTESIDSHPDLLSSSLIKHLHHSNMTKLVQQLIDEMTVERDREVLLSYFLDGKDKSVICSQLGLSDTHFDRVLYRARHRLKQLIEHKLNESEHSSINNKVIWAVLLFCVFSDDAIIFYVGDTKIYSTISIIR